MAAPQRKLSGEYYSLDFSYNTNCPNKDRLAKIGDYLRASYRTKFFGMFAGCEMKRLKLQPVEHDNKEYNVAAHRHQVFFRRKGNNSNWVIPEFYIDENGNECAIRLYNKKRFRWIGLLQIVAGILLFNFIAIPGIGLVAYAFVIPTLLVNGINHLLKGVFLHAGAPAAFLLTNIIELCVGISIMVTAASLLLTNPIGFLIGTALVLSNLYELINLARTVNGRSGQYLHHDRCLGDGVFVMEDAKCVEDASLAHSTVSSSQLPNIASGWHSTSRRSNIKNPARTPNSLLSSSNNTNVLQTDPKSSSSVTETNAVVPTPTPI